MGVSKVATAGEFEAALAAGFEHDRKLLAEEFIRGREIECSVLEDAAGGLFVSRPGEIVPAESHGFYSYDAKYVDENGAALKVPAELPQEIESRIREIAGNAFRAVGCDGMARVDFFVTADMRILVNEINTIPGFTDISMYSKAMAASGVELCRDHRPAGGAWVGARRPIARLAAPETCGRRLRKDLHRAARGPSREAAGTVARGTQSIGIRQAAARAGSPPQNSAIGWR